MTDKGNGLEISRSSDISLDTGIQKFI